MIENITDTEVKMYVLSKLEPAGVDVQSFMHLCTNWYYAASDKHPLSFELAKHGLTEPLSEVLCTFDLEYVSRIIGLPSKFKFTRVKCRKKKITRGVKLPEVRFK